MALIEGLEIYIPQEAEVRSVPLRFLPSSVLRKMGQSVELSEASDCMWICPALFQRKGQKQNPQNQGGARQHMLTVLGNSLGKNASSAKGSTHWKMSFVTANTTAYKVLKETLPEDPSTQLFNTAKVHQGPPSNSEQDAVIVHNGRVYLSVKRKKQELPLSHRPTVVLQRLDMSQGPDQSQMAPVVHSRLKRKLDTPHATTETARAELSDSGLQGVSPEVSLSQGADVIASCRRGPNQVRRARRSRGAGPTSSQLSRQSQTATLGTSQRAIQIQEADQSHMACQEAGDIHEVSLGATQRDCIDQEPSREESGDQGPSQAPYTLQSAPPYSPTQSWGPTVPPTLPDWGPTVPSARQQEFDFQELARRERIAQMTAKLQRSDMGLRSL